jgi:hypothetical protein
MPRGAGPEIFFLGRVVRLNVGINLPFVGPIIGEGRVDLRQREVRTLCHDLFGRVAHLAVNCNALNARPGPGNARPATQHARSGLDHAPDIEEKRHSSPSVYKARCPVLIYNRLAGTLKK